MRRHGHKSGYDIDMKNVQKPSFVEMNIQNPVRNVLGNT